MAKEEKRNTIYLHYLRHYDTKELAELHTDTVGCDSPCSREKRIMQPVPRLTIAHAPFARLVLPLAAGIALQNAFPSDFAAYLCGGIALVATAIYVASGKAPLSTIRRYSLGIAITAAMLCTGMVAMEASRCPTELPPMGDSTIAVARIEEQPAAHSHTLQARALIVATDDDTAMHTAALPVLLYFKPSYTASQLQRGDLILFRPALRRIEPPELPYAFDFARYMQLEGITQSQYLRDDEWQLSTRTDRPGIYDYAQRLQHACVQSLYGIGLSDENAVLLAAVIWGYKNDIPETARECFSAAGLSHMLAVSGLHTGIIAFVLWLLFYPLRATPLRGLRGIATIILLWVYAFVTGLSPSVTRACIMATFIGVAQILNRRNSTLNALCGSATFILAIAPQQLFDIGFQLSYAAVTGIVLLAPYIDVARRMECRHVLLSWVSGLLAVSVAAQAATAILAAFYFHYIPIWGLLANIVLVPLLPLPIVAALLTQAAAAMHLPHNVLAAVAEWLTTLLTDGADMVASLPGAVINNVWITLPAVACYMSLLYVVWRMLQERRLRWLPVALGIAIVLQGLYLYESMRCIPSHCIVPTTKRSTTLLMNDSERNGLIISTDTTPEVPRIGTEMRMRYDICARRIVQGDTLATPHLYADLPFISYYGSRLLWVSDDALRYQQKEAKITIDHAIITEGYRGKISDLCRSFDVRHVVLAAAIYPDRATLLQEECRRLGIPCHNIDIDGVWYAQDTQHSGVQPTTADATQQ